MTKLDGSDRNTIEYRPAINFVEPLADDEPLIGTKADEVDLEGNNEQLDKLDRLALAGDLLADAMQSRVDDKVGDFVVKLDKDIDRPVSDALRRKYGDIDPTQITFQQYRECRENMRQYGVDKAEELEPDDDDIREGRINPAGPLPLDIASAEAKGGLLRPETQFRTQVVPPVDIDKFQQDMECLLMNVLWKRFIRPLLKIVIPPPFGLLLPEEICDPLESAVAIEEVEKAQEEAERALREAAAASGGQ